MESYGARNVERHIHNALCRRKTKRKSKFGSVFRFVNKLKRRDGSIRFEWFLSICFVKDAGTILLTFREKLIWKFSSIRAPCHILVNDSSVWSWEVLLVTWHNNIPERTHQKCGDQRNKSEIRETVDQTLAEPSFGARKQTPGAEFE